jgi:uncharacterized protein
MFFSVRDLELRKADFDVRIQPGQLNFSDNHLKQAGPLHAVGVAELESLALGEIRVKGTYSVVIECDCDRCLDPAEFPIEKQFDLFYHPESAQSTQGEVHLAEGESEIGFYEGDGLELNDVLREQVLLDLPMQRVCKPDCKGVCPYCGQNRNTSVCNCQVAPVDDRWSALKRLTE